MHDFIKFVVNKVPAAFKRDGSFSLKEQFNGLYASVYFNNYLQNQFVDCLDGLDHKSDAAISEIDRMRNDARLDIESAGGDIFKTIDVFYDTIKKMRDEFINCWTVSGTMPGEATLSGDLFAFLLDCLRTDAEGLRCFYDGSTKKLQHSDRSPFRNTEMAEKKFNEIKSLFPDCFPEGDRSVAPRATEEAQAEFTNTIAPYVALLISFWEEEPGGKGGAEYFFKVFVACELIARGEFKLDVAQPVVSKFLVNATESGLSEKFQEVQRPPASKKHPELSQNDIEFGNSILGLYTSFVNLRDRIMSLSDDLTLASEGYTVMVLERYYDTRMVVVAMQIVEDGLVRKTTIDEARSALRELTCRPDKLPALSQDREIFVPLFEELTATWSMA
jgi:hypothetical protein